MHRDRITLIVLSLTLATSAVVSCTSSEPVTMTGAAGAKGSGAAGSTGAAGMTTGAAGMTTGAAGMTTGAAGSTTGAAGSTTGAAGSTTGAAGSTTGAAGSTTGAAGSTTGAAGSTADAGAAGASGGTVSFATDIYPFLKTQCMPCHTKATNQDGGPLDMSSPMAAYTSLVGTATPPTGAAAKTDTSCKLLDTKKLRVEPGDPAHSYLYIKITNTDTQLGGQNCGPAMPKTGSNLTLTADQKTKIQSWIMGGAKP